MTRSPGTVDFGAPLQFGAHVFRVEVPEIRDRNVRIVEDYGFRGDQEGIPREEDRVVLARWVWSAVASAAQREFNARLKAAKTHPGRWHSGVNLVDRLLGRELCVLAWASETAERKQIPVICGKWLALRPEERWWLFSQTVAEAGLPQDTQRGWRRGLYLALSDGEKSDPARPRRRPSDSEMVNLSLFEEIS